MIGRIFLAAFARGFVSEQQPHAKPSRRRRPFRNTDLPREAVPVPTPTPGTGTSSGNQPEPMGTAAPVPVVPPGHVDTGTFSRLAQDDAERRAWLDAAVRREDAYWREQHAKKGGEV